MQRCCQQTNEALIRETLLFQCFWIVACQHSLGISYFLNTCHFQFFRENLAFDVKRLFLTDFLLSRAPDVLISCLLQTPVINRNALSLFRPHTRTQVDALNLVTNGWYQSDHGLNSSPSIDILAPKNVALTLLRFFSVQSERATYMDCRSFYLHMSIPGKGYSTERIAVLTPASERKQAYWCCGEQMIWTDKVEM